MKRMMLATAVTALTAGSALAATDIDQVDLTGDDFVSMEELKVVFPDFDVEFFDNIDTNDDNRISREEILATEAQDILARYDMVPVEARVEPIVLDDDGDGFISIDDMRRGYPSFTALDFEEIDTNDDNRVSYNEIYTTEAQDIVARYETAGELTHAMIDTDSDDFVSFEEMAAAFPTADAEDFEMIDLNDDNRVSYDEFYTLESQEVVNRLGS